MATSAAAAAAATAAPAASTALAVFLRERLAEASGPNLEQLFEEWRQLPTCSRERFEEEARTQRAAIAASRSADAAELKRRLLGQHSAAGLITASASSRLQAAKRRLATRCSMASARVPTPVFPAAPGNGGAAALDVTAAPPHKARRQELAGAVKARAKEAMPSSCRLSLSEVSERLDAPTLSCDWQHQDSSDDDRDGSGRSRANAAGDALVVDMPGQASGVARQLMAQDLRHRCSSVEVRKLAMKSRGEAEPSMC